MFRGIKTMRFRNNIIDLKVNEAVKKANDLIQAGSKLINDISEKNDFKYNSGDGVQVALNLIRAREPVGIYMYKPLYPFSKALGKFDGENIWINFRKMEAMSSDALIGLLLHEYAHYCGYSHGNNYKSKDKIFYSVPYFLSENVSRWL